MNAIANLRCELLAAKSKTWHCSVVIWTAISRYSLDPMITLQSSIIGKNYATILADYIHAMVQSLFPNGDVVFEDDNAHAHIFRILQADFESMRVICRISPRPPQLPYLNIIEPLSHILERKVRNHYSFPSSLPELAFIFRMNGVRFLWKPYMICIYPF